MLSDEVFFKKKNDSSLLLLLGHYSSFILILYGDEIDDVFKKDATKLKNVLMNKKICGVP